MVFHRVQDGLGGRKEVKTGVGDWRGRKGEDSLFTMAV
jgi:hypothetical protein